VHQLWLRVINRTLPVSEPRKGMWGQFPRFGEIAKKGVYEAFGAFGGFRAQASLSAMPGRVRRRFQLCPDKWGWRGRCAEPVRNERRGSCILRDSLWGGGEWRLAVPGRTGMGVGAVPGLTRHCEVARGGTGGTGAPFIESSALERPEPIPAFWWGSLDFVRSPVSALAVEALRRGERSEGAERRGIGSERKARLCGVAVRPEEPATRTEITDTSHNLSSVSLRGG
jgi:hypothetical protein